MPRNDEKQKPKVGRPAMEREPRQYTLMLYADQSINIDRLALDIQEFAGVKIERSAIVRAAVDVLLQHKALLKECKSEEEIAGQLLRALGKK